MRVESFPHITDPEALRIIGESLARHTPDRVRIVGGFRDGQQIVWDETVYDHELRWIEEYLSRPWIDNEVRTNPHAHRNDPNGIYWNFGQPEYQMIFWDEKAHRRKNDDPHALWETYDDIKDQWVPETIDTCPHCGQAYRWYQQVLGFYECVACKHWPYDLNTVQGHRADVMLVDDELEEIDPQVVQEYFDHLSEEERREIQTTWAMDMLTRDHGKRSDLCDTYLPPYSTCEFCGTDLPESTYDKGQAICKPCSFMIARNENIKEKDYFYENERWVTIGHFLFSDQTKQWFITHTKRQFHRALKGLQTFESKLIQICL